MRMTRTFIVKFLCGCIAYAAQTGLADDKETAKPPPKTPPTPCVDRKEFSHFDFWLGSWKVHDVTGKKFFGSNNIEKMPGGCVLVERWSGRGGSSGVSMNYYDSAERQWVQVWSGSGGSQITIRGGLQDESMRLEGMIHYVDPGRSAPFRGTWTPLGDGRVRQFFEESPDNGKTWKPWFEGIYSRAAE